MTSSVEARPPAIGNGIVVVGAGGRVGRAVVREALTRAVPVIAVVRDPDAHRELYEAGVTLVAGDARSGADLTPAARGAMALVSAVTPFTRPPTSFEGFDEGWHADVAEALMETGVPRIVSVGLFAALPGEGARPVLEDPESFPEFLRPFARSHVRGVERFAAADEGVDWAVLAPPPALDTAAVATGRYELGGRPPSRQHWNVPFAHADLARAVLDEVEHPTVHRSQAGVWAGARTL